MKEREREDRRDESGVGWKTCSVVKQEEEATKSVEGEIEGCAINHEQGILSSVCMSHRE